MSTELDFETFDLAEVLAGRGYPEKEVSVYFDEQVGYAIHEFRQRMRLLESDEYASAEKELAALVESLNDQRYTFTLRGVPMQVQSDIFKRAKAQFEPKKKSGTIDNDEVVEHYTNLLWAAYIVKITSPSGAVQTSPGEDAVALIRAKAPAAAIAAIQEGISELAEGTKSGFEYAAKSADFLSGASREATAEGTPPLSE